MMMAAVAVILLVLLCGGLVAVGGVAALFGMGGDTPTEQPVDPGTDTEVGTGDTAEPGTEEPGTEEPATEAPAPVKAKARSKSSTRRAPRRPRAPSPPPVTAGPSRVTFMVPAAGSITCGDGQSTQVDGSTTMTFPATVLPVSCMVSAGGGRWAGMVTKGGSVRCSVDGVELNCTGP